MWRSLSARSVLRAAPSTSASRTRAVVHQLNQQRGRKSRAIPDPEIYTNLHERLREQSPWMRDFMDSNAAMIMGKDEDSLQTVAGFARLLADKGLEPVPGQEPRLEDIIRAMDDPEIQKKAEEVVELVDSLGFESEDLKSLAMFFHPISMEETGFKPNPQDAFDSQEELAAELGVSVDESFAMGFNVRKNEWAPKERVVDPFDSWLLRNADRIRNRQKLDWDVSPELHGSYLPEVIQEAARQGVKLELKEDPALAEQVIKAVEVAGPEDEVSQEMNKEAWGKFSGEIRSLFEAAKDPNAPAPELSELNEFQRGVYERVKDSPEPMKAFVEAYIDAVLEKHEQSLEQLAQALHEETPDMPDEDSLMFSAQDEETLREHFGKGATPDFGNAVGKLLEMDNPEVQDHMRRFLEDFGTQMQLDDSEATIAEDAAEDVDISEEEMNELEELKRMYT